jgi:hypothetical protein
MTIEFYDVKTRRKIKVDDKQVVKTKFTTRSGQVRFSLRIKTEDGRNLTKFVSQKDWEKSNYPEG